MKMQVKPLLISKCICVYVMFKNNTTDSESYGSKSLAPLVYLKQNNCLN